MHMPLAALVVDDSMLVRHTICRFLQERGFVVTAVSNGVEALAKLKDIRPSLIVTDLQMPKMDGIQLITQLKDNPSTAQIPIVIVSGCKNELGKAEKRADFVINKDIEVESQLRKALAAIFGSAAAAGTTT